MKKYINGKYVEMTAEEISKISASVKVSFKEAVISRIREKYSIDDELAILRKRDSKPEEFAEYNAFVEKVKAEVKEVV